MLRVEVRLRTRVDEAEPSAPVEIGNNQRDAGQSVGISNDLTSHFPQSRSERVSTVNKTRGVHRQWRLVVVLVFALIRALNRYERRLSMLRLTSAERRLLIC